MKEAALRRTDDPASKQVRFTPEHCVLVFLEALGLCGVTTPQFHGWALDHGGRRPSSA